MEDRFRFYFDCLQRKIVFCHGISDSPLPLGSSAIVEYSDEYIDGYSRTNVDHTCDDGTTSCSRNQVGGRSGSFDGVAASRPWRNGSYCRPDSITNKCSELMGSVCECCGYFHKYSFDRMINTLAPVASVNVGYYSKFEDLASDFSSGSLEDHSLFSLSLLIEGKATGRDGLNFLNMISMPGESTHPGCLRHPNIIPIIGILKSSENINFMLPKVPDTLESILYFSPDAIKSEWDIQLLIYQILSVLVYMHSMGFAQGVHPHSLPFSEVIRMLCLVSFSGDKTSYQSREIKPDSPLYSNLLTRMMRIGYNPTETPHRQSGCKENVGVIGHQHSSILWVIRCRNGGRLP